MTARFHKLRLCFVLHLIVVFSLSFALAVREEKLISAPDISAHLRSPSFSTSTQDEALRRCAFLLTDPLAELQTEAGLVAVAKNCHTLAHKYEKYGTKRGLTRLVVGLAETHLGRYPAFEAAMVESRELSPNEGWLAQARVLAVTRESSQIGPQVRAAAAGDIAVLLQSGDLAQTVAHVYARDHRTRLFMREVVQTLPPNLQQAFLNNLRQFGTDLNG